MSMVDINQVIKSIQQLQRSLLNIHKPSNSSSTTAMRYLTGQDFNWKLLRQWCLTHNVPISKENYYGIYLNSYPEQAWKNVYGINLNDYI